MYVMQGARENFGWSRVVTGIPLILFYIVLLYGMYQNMPTTEDHSIAQSPR
jgi:hypothetical protein